MIQRTAEQINFSPKQTSRVGIELMIYLSRLLVRTLYSPLLGKGKIFRVSLLEVSEHVGQMAI